MHNVKNAKNATDNKIHDLEESIENLYKKLEEKLHDLEVAKDNKSILEAKIEYMNNLCTIDLVWDLDYFLENHFIEKYFLESYIRISSINDDVKQWIKNIWNDFPNIVIKDEIIAISKIIAYCGKTSELNKLRIYCPTRVCKVVQYYVPELQQENFITN